ncbi:Cytochrome P450, partial [Dillenia turbinata]
MEKTPSEITMKLVMSATRWMALHLHFSDVAISLLGLFIFSCTLQRLTNKGPMLWPVLGIIPTLFFHLDDLYSWATEAFIKCRGSFHYRGMWFGGAYGILTVDPTNIEYMLKTRFRNFPKGKYYRERFNDLLGDGIFNADDESWKEQRRVATSEMHSSRFVEHSSRTIEDLVCQKLLKLIEKLVMSGDAIDLQEVLLRFTFDNICMAAFGVDPGCLSLELPEIPFAKAFEEATEFTLFRFMVPPCVWKPMKFLNLGPEKRLKEAVEIVHDFAQKTVANRRLELAKLGSLNNRSDLLSRLIEINSEQGKKYHFNDKFLRDFCISFILAGRDTSSVALAWFFWLISRNPQVESRIVSELHDILKERKSGKQNLSDVVFTAEELKKMVYLHAALSEALRLYPSVPIDFKEVIEDDVLPDGLVVKKGARVLYCMFSMARMESIWGKDCKEFKPERWIKDGQFLSENQFKYAVFNAGPRLCVGKKFAYTQMKMVAASILLRYSIEVVEGWNVVPKITTTLYMKNGLMVTFKPRLASRSALSGGFEHIFGVDPGCLGIDLLSVPFPKACTDATEFTLNRFLVPPFVWKIMKFFNIGSEKQLRKALQIVQDFAGKTVVDRQVESSKIDFSYLQAVLSESTRQYPPVPVDLKEVVEDDMFPYGTMVKKKSRVLFSVFTMARMEGIWGKGCQEFKPERRIREGQFVSQNQFQ